MTQERDRASELVCRQDAKDAALHESTQNSSATADDEEPPGEGAVTAGNQKTTEKQWMLKLMSFSGMHC